MAQQPKSYKKFVATAATASLVASALVPVAASAAAPSFTDVPASYKDAVDYLVSKGANGLSATEFGISKEITRGDAAVLLAGALGVLDEKAPASGFTDVPARAATAVNSLKAAGIINGKTATSFGFGDNLKRGEVALILAKAYKLTGDASKLAFTDVNDRYKDSVAALVEAKVTSGISATQFGTDNNIKRGDFAKFAFGLKDGVSTGAATKVDTVSATNLKEVEVKFDGTVDKASAEDLEKYSVDSSVELESAVLLEDGKTVRLTVKPFTNGLVLQNQKSYKVSVKNVKAGEKFVDASNVAFTPVDNTLPEVSSVKSLGTKAVKVTFSEPVKKATSTNFKLDGKSYFGSVSEGARSVILKPYSSSDLTIGEHKLEISGVEDFAGFKSLSKEFTFDVVEDTAAPTVKSVSATLEKVTVTFSEEVDPETVVKSNIFWKSGADKKAAGSVTEIAPDVYEFDFTDNALPGYEVTLFVEGVKDYSGNKITETEVKVRAEVDQTRPEVSEAAISKTNDNNITLKFNKTVKVDDIKYFTLTDSKGKAVPIRTVTAANGTTEDKVFTIQTYGSLDDTYTLKVIGVRDTTKLQNTMNDYSVTLTGKDNTAPNYSSNSANSNTRTIIINFDEKMDLASLADKKNYLVTINDKSQQLPEGTEVTPVQDGNAVRIVFPEYIDNDVVGFNSSTFGANITAFKLLALKDAAGTIINQFGGSDILVNTALATLADEYDENTTQVAKMTAKGEVKVRFNQPIGKAVASDFKVLSGTGVSISSVTTDGSDVVTLTLSGSVGNTALVSTSDESAITLAVNAVNKITTTSGNGVVQSQATISVKDGVKPEVQLATGESRLNVVDNAIELPFSEVLGGNAADYKHDLVVTNVRTGAEVPVTKFNTSTSTGKLVIITLDSSIATTDEYKVSVKSNAAHIVDVALNKAVASSTYLTKVGGMDTVKPTFVSAVVQDAKADEVVVTFSEAITLTDATGFDIIVDGSAANVASTTATASKVVFKLSAAVAKDDVVTIAYNGSGNVKDNANNTLAAFAVKTVENKVTVTTP